MEQSKKDNTFRWLLRFAGQCRGTLTASVLLAVLGAACGAIPSYSSESIFLRIQ